MPNINHPDYFPELRFHTLEAHAHRWGKSGSWPYSWIYFVAIDMIIEKRFERTQSRMHCQGLFPLVLHIFYVGTQIITADLFEPLLTRLLDKL